MTSSTKSIAAAVSVSAVLLMSGAAISGQAKPPVQSTAPKPGTLTVTVVSDAGANLDRATVLLRGAVDRQTTTAADGVANLQNIPPGTYRARVSREGFFTFEKEVLIRAGAKTATEAALSPAPPPMPQPAPPKEREKEPAPVRPVGAAGPVGTAKVLSLTDLAEQMLRDPALIVEREIGCSVASASRLILIRETLPSHSHADADEMLYLVAGDATLKIADKDSSISAGWFGLVPRGASHTLSKRGRNAPIFLSIRSGAPCGG